MTPHGRLRLVLDTNTLLRGLARRDSASGRILRACEQHTVLLLLSRPVVREYLTVLADDKILGRHAEITPESVALVLRRLRYVADHFNRLRVRFRFDRDRRDEKFIELAIAGKATHIITADKDLLSLASDHTEAARRFRQRLPKTRVLDPEQFLREHETLLPFTRG